MLLFTEIEEIVLNKLTISLVGQPISVNKKFTSFFMHEIFPIVTRKLYIAHR